jgi:hypothetical protein
VLLLCARIIPDDPEGHRSSIDKVSGYYHRKVHPGFWHLEPRDARADGREGFLREHADLAFSPVAVDRAGALAHRKARRQIGFCGHYV